MIGISEIPLLTTSNLPKYLVKCTNALKIASSSLSYEYMVEMLGLIFRIVKHGLIGKLG